ncbi:pentraxin fusion protein-like isoform X2 [Ostrea edulis]|uniref:pentraxin fusion protein-like isoform X2 n=1 Tax=Ostrea edulis TaxID=37623 RepID=UPI0024AFC0F2|nr:pentraxin fusion protein-like isoform X2 [Ostrea edulis]
MERNVYVLLGAEICKTGSPSGYQCRLLMNYKKQGYVATDPSNQDCQFLEMEEKDVINVAAKRPTSVSSIRLGQSQFGPSNVVDGVTDCPLLGGYLAMTRFQISPWIQVDFESPVDVLKVLIFGRQDCCYERLHNLHVSVHDGVTYHVCGYYDGPPTQRTHIMVYCKNIIQSPLVVITLNGGGLQSLELCEMAVFGR